jgi:hypothetical protein
MAKRGNTKALDAFRRQVKHIQRSTGKSYRAAQKQASAEHKHKGHKRVTGTKRKRKARPRTKSVQRVTRVVQRTVGAAPRKRGGSTVKKKMKNIQEQLAKQLGVHEMKRIASNTRKAFNYHGKKISEIRSQIRRLC